MNREILKNYQKKDDKILLAHILDKIEICANRNKIEHTDFLDLMQIDLVQKFIEKIKIENYMSYGGYENAERKIFVIYPDKFNPEAVAENLSNIVQIIRIELPEDLKGKFTHRDYLGAVIKLGVKREKVGDIIVDNAGADIIIDKDISKFLLENLNGLTRFSKSTIKLEKIENFNIPELQTYVNGIRIDINAVKNGIKLKYNNGLAEGSVNKIKVIKRIMYGRNSFDLLKAKVLLHEHFRCEFN